MSDHDDTENLSTPALDHINAALALVDLAGEFYDMALNAKVYKSRLKKLAALEKKNAAAEAKLAAAEAKAAELVAKAESDVAAIHDEARQRLEAAESAEQDLCERERRIQILEAAWRYISEPQDVLSGFRSPEFSPLQKARMAHGQPPGKDLDIHGFSEPDAAPARIDALIRHDAGDERSDAQGNAFTPSTLRRDLSHKRGAA